MRLEKQRATELRLWATGRLEALTETDSSILADYAVQLLNGDTPIEETRKHAAASLQDFLADDTAQFVAELFVKATSHLRPPEPTPNATPRPSTRKSPIPQAPSALRSAAALSYAPSGPRKRNFAQATGNEDHAHHIGNHNITKRVRGIGINGDNPTRGNWRGRGRVMTGANTQPAGPGIGNAPFNMPNPPTPPPGMIDFNLMYPYMAAMMASAQAMMAKTVKCEYFDNHGYCMRGDTCHLEHAKQTPDVEARHKIEGHASDNETARGSRRQAQYTRRLSSTAKSNDPRALSYSANEASTTPEEPNEPQTPEEPEIDIEAFKISQKIKQEDHKARIATLEEHNSQKAILTQKTIKMEAKIAAEKAKLMAKPGGNKILVQINSERKETTPENAIEADVMSLGSTPGPPLRHASSTQSDVVGYLGKKQAICKYIPNCTNRSCTYKHTAKSSASISTVMCKFLPNCINRDCAYKHGNNVSSTSDVLCKFFPNCTKEGCTFKHLGGRPTLNVQCNFFPDCTRDDCTFKHGEGGMSHIVCKYYPDCTIPRCSFKHPEGSVHSGAVKRVDNRPKNLLISGVSASFNNSADSMGMVRVAVSAITNCESIQPQSFHDSSLAGEDAHDGLVVTFAERWQAEMVLKGLTMVGGVGRVKCVWYLGPIDGILAGTPRTELEVDADSIYGEEEDGDVKLDYDVDITIKEEDLDVAGEDDEWKQIS